MSHPMMPQANHDERAEQLFVLDLKVWMSEEVDPLERELVEAIGGSDGHIGEVRDTLMQQETFRAWIGYRRLSQEMMWESVGNSIDRQMDDLQRKARTDRPKGSITLDPDFKVPAYLSALDIHMMPGGYHHDRGQGDIRQGALIDRGGAVYMLGRNGGMMNDVRGHTTVQHLLECYPDVQPLRILDMGCAVGASTVAVASYFPDAEVHGIDVGGAMLRYAHARSEQIGERVHYAQANAEHTDFADASFDVVYSCVLLHETSPDATRAIMDECHRLLRPGGVMIHMEVPSRLEELGLWGEVLGDFEANYNNEPFWRGAQSIDFDALVKDAGFDAVAIGYQMAAPRASRHAKPGFSDISSGPFRSWYIVSARKPA